MLAIDNDRITATLFEADSSGAEVAAADQAQEAGQHVTDEDEDEERRADGHVLEPAPVHADRGGGGGGDDDGTDATEKDVRFKLAAHDLVREVRGLGVHADQIYTARLVDLRLILIRTSALPARVQTRGTHPAANSRCLSPSLTASR